MTEITISQECDDRVARKLFTVYGEKFDLDLADEMLKALRYAPQPPTDAEYEDAVGRWIAESKWAPKPSDILGLINAARSEQTLSRAAAAKTYERETSDLTSHPPESTTTRTVEVQIGQGRVQTLTYKVDSYTVTCRDCSDRGIAHFYAAKDNPRSVYLAQEWDKMTEQQQFTYRHHIAICDCPRGLTNPKRDNRTVEWYRGREREMSVYALMEYVRKLARQREDAEQVPLVIMEKGRYGY